MTRPFTLCHTSDWHLGHVLGVHARDDEHRRFFDFLLDLVARERVDALIVAGDVFDTSNPSAAAQAAYYRFLAEARRRAPALDVLIVAGNHDSAPRLSAPDPVLRALGVRVVGAVPRLGQEGRGEIDTEGLVVPLRAADGEVGAWVAALPFLRPFDLPPGPLGAPRLEGVRRVYAAALERARASRGAEQALIATGHCHMVGSSVSAESERTVIGGLDEAYPVDLFGDDVDYAALGHLHLAQHVGDREHVRYSGSPIPLSMAEERYPHQVRIVRFEAGRLASQEAVRVPRAVELLSVPRRRARSLDADSPDAASPDAASPDAASPDAPASLDHVLAELAQLELPAGLAPHERPFLEVQVRLTEPVPDLRQRVEAALADRPVRLVRIAVERTASTDALPELAPQRNLRELSVEEVFRSCYARSREGEPSPALLDAFREVADVARVRLEELAR